MEIKQILVVILCVLAFMFSWLLVLLKIQKSKANHYLSVFLGVMFCMYLLKAFEEFSLPSLTVWAYLFIIPMMLSTVPILFMYIQKMTNHHFRFSKICYLHFLPALIVLIVNVLSYGQIPYKDKILLASGVVENPEVMPLLKFYVNTYKVSQYAYDLQAIVYGIIMLKLLQLHKRKISDLFSYKENISLSWLQVFVIVFLAVSIVEVMLYSFVWFIAAAGEAGMTAALFNGYEMFSLSLSIAFTMFLGFFGLKQPDIYQLEEEVPIKEIVLSNDNDKAATPITTQENDTESSAGSQIESPDNKKAIKRELTNEQKSVIIDDLLKIMEKDKLYLNSDLSLIDIADAIHTNKNYLSSIINERFGKNFYHFINEYRVKHAISMIDSSRYNHITIEGIAHSSGFKSKSVFNPAFKKFTGKTPSEYRADA